jgi:hypothetical protein
MPPLSQDQKMALEDYLRTAYADSKCSAFLEEFIAEVNSGKFAAFLGNKLGAVSPEVIVERAFRGFNVMRINEMDAECIDAAINDIVSRISWNT